MALAKQIITIPFGGLETKVDPKLVPPGRTLVLENAEFNETGAIIKRNGYTKIHTGAGTGRALVSFRDELLMMYRSGTGPATKEQIWAYSAQMGQWAAKGQCPTARARAVPIGIGHDPAESLSLSLIPGEVDVAVANNIAVYLFVYAGNFRATVVDLLTGAEIKSGEILSVGGSAPSGDPPNRLVTVGSRIYRIHEDAGALSYSYLDTATWPLSWSASVNFVAYDPTIAFDACASGTDIFVATRNVAGTAAELTRLTTPAHVATTISVAEVPASNLAVTVANGVAMVAYRQNATNNIRIFGRNNNGTLTSAFAAATVATVATAARLTMCEINSGDAALFYDFDSSNEEAVAAAVVRNTGSIVSAARTIVRGARVASKPAYINSAPHIGILTRSGNTTVTTQVQGEYMLITYNTTDEASPTAYDIISVVTKQLTGRTIDPTAGAGLVDRTISSLVQWTSGVYLWGGVGRYSQGLLLNTSANNSAGVPFMLEVNFNTVPPVADAGESMFIASGLLREYDGDAPYEHNFIMFPDDISSTTQANGGSLADGTYNLAAVYAWFDSRGRIHWGTPMLLGSQAVAHGTGTAVINTEFPALRVTQKPNAIAFLYATAASGAIYYETDYDDNDASANTVTGDVLAITTTNRTLYTTGGIVPNEDPPAASSVAVSGGRVFLYCEDGRVWYSKAPVAGEAYGFAEDFTFAPIDDGGRSFVLCDMDGVLVMFGENSIQVVAGEGPTDSGALNGFSTPRLVASDVGALFDSPVVKTDEGVFFKSRRGIMLLNRSLQTEYVGAPVEAYNSLSLASATLVASKQQVRFGHSDGPTLVYDYYTKQWSVFTNHTSIAATNWQGRFVWMNSAGSVYAQSTDYADDVAPINLVAESGWIKLSALQGFQRLYYASLLGEWRSDHTLTVKVYYDYAPAVAETRTFAATGAAQGYSPGDPLQVRLHLGRKCQAVKFRIEDSDQAGTKESLRLTGIELEVGGKGGVFRQSSSRTI